MYRASSTSSAKAASIAFVRWPVTASNFDVMLASALECGGTNGMNVSCTPKGQLVDGKK
jgi:hypothetical protein